MATAIQVENLSKAYQIGQIGTGTISKDLQRWWLTSIRGKEDPYLKIGETNDRAVKGESNIVWSLKDINFEIEQGDAVGIIGRNGAGKSTLLKVLSEVTSPTTGKINIKGRVASLLEVGTGFHPELTGRENIFLNGAILGMRKKEIQRKLDQIIDFSGVERYVDTPVKRYSSGMYVRLAFAVAAHLESEILIVDEVLAVGDAEFQKKCLGKMNEVSKGEGRTVLFVSHNMDAILRLCNNSILIRKGELIEQGTSEKVITKYLNQELSLSAKKQYEGKEAPGSDVVILLSSEVTDSNFINRVNYLITERVGIKIIFKILKPTDDLKIGFNLYNQMDVHILSSHQMNGNSHFEIGIYETIVWLPGNFMAEGLHYCGIAAMSYKPFTVHFHDIKQFTFNVSDYQGEETGRGEYTGKLPGVIRPVLQWDTINKL